MCLVQLEGHDLEHLVVLKLWKLIEKPLKNFETQAGKALARSWHVLLGFAPFPHVHPHHAYLDRHCNRALADPIVDLLCGFFDHIPCRQNKSSFPYYNPIHPDLDHDNYLFP